MNNSALRSKRQSNKPLSWFQALRPLALSNVVLTGLLTAVAACQSSELAEPPISEMASGGSQSDMAPIPGSNMPDDHDSSSGGGKVKPSSPMGRGGSSAMQAPTSGGSGGVDTGGASSGGTKSGSGGSAGDELPTGGAAGAPPNVPSTPEEVRAAYRDTWISEYLESGANKALEITNRASSPVDFSACEVRLFTNGASTPSKIIPLDITDSKQVIVLCHSGADQAIQARCDISTGSLNFNGDDAVGLWCYDVALDVIGQIGLDPGTAWSNDQLSTEDSFLVRSCDVTAGRYDGSQMFDLTGWLSQPLTSRDSLDEPECEPISVAR